MAKHSNKIVQNLKKNKINSPIKNEHWVSRRKLKLKLQTGKEQCCL